MTRRSALLAALLGALSAGTAAASAPGAWTGQTRTARAACIAASHLLAATASAEPALFSDRVGYDVLRLRGRLRVRPSGTVPVTMLCLYERRTNRVREIVEAPAGW